MVGTVRLAHVPGDGVGILTKRIFILGVCGIVAIAAYVMGYRASGSVTARQALRPTIVRTFASRIAAHAFSPAAWCEAQVLGKYVILSVTHEREVFVDVAEFVPLDRPKPFVDDRFDAQMDDYLKENHRQSTKWTRANNAAGPALGGGGLGGGGFSAR